MIQPGNGHSLHILLAEDGRVNQFFATQLLEQRGYKVTLAENGREAVELFETKSFDAILMDIQMPEMNGLEATAAIRKLEEDRGGHLPIIAMTASAMAGDLEKCLESGMDAYTAKPVKPDTLFSALEKLTSQQSDDREVS